MKEEYEPVGIVILNKETAINSIEYLPKETCAEKVLGRCKGCSISNPGLLPDSENCLNYKPARIERIK